MYSTSNYQPPGNHNWVREYPENPETNLWVCEECGIRTTYIIPSQYWMWLSSFGKIQFGGLPTSCAENKIIEALE